MIFPVSPTHPIWRGWVKVLRVTTKCCRLRRPLNCYMPPVVVEEKLNGANLGFSFGPDGAVRAQNRASAARSTSPEDVRLSGEPITCAQTENGVWLFFLTAVTPYFFRKLPDLRWGSVTKYLVSVKPKPNLPWRRRQQAATKKTWWVKLWASRTALVSVATIGGAAIGWVLTNGVESLSNLRKLPSEVKNTYHMFQSWYYDDAKWTGTWSSRMEGYVEDFQQSEVPLKISIHTERGKVFGEIFNRRVCDLNPMLPPVLVEGEVRGAKLFAYTYAYVGGEKNILYSFTAIHNEGQPIITLMPYEDPYQLLPSSARLVKSIETEAVSDSAIATTVEVEHPDLKCSESPVEYIHRMLKEQAVVDAKQPSKDSEAP